MGAASHFLLQSAPRFFQTPPASGFRDAANLEFRRSGQLLFRLNRIRTRP